MNEITGYNLFWDEEKKVYCLRDGEETIGELPDDTKFANSVMGAFQARLELSRLKNQLFHLKRDMESIVQTCEKNL